jgi:hypothetical protein
LWRRVEGIGAKKAIPSTLLHKKSQPLSAAKDRLAKHGEIYLDSEADFKEEKNLK